MKEILIQAVNRIQDDEIRNFTLKVIEAAPEASWRLSSSLYHHMQDERGEWGNLNHTVRVFRICEAFAEALELLPRETDYLLSAAILHDICKHGINAEYQFVCRSHPLFVRHLIDKAGEISNPAAKPIIALIEQHMGRWGTPACDWRTSNEITPAFILHAADCIEAHLDAIIPV